jgi:hypothetical protein
MTCRYWTAAAQQAERENKDAELQRLGPVVMTSAEYERYLAGDTREIDALIEEYIVENVPF